MFKKLKDKINYLILERRFKRQMKRVHDELERERIENAEKKMRVIPH